MIGAALEAALLLAIVAKSYRGEASLCREFDPAWKGRRAQARSEKVEDALFALVQRKDVEWFGAESDPGAPMNYRATVQGRNVARRLREARALRGAA